MPPKCRRLNYFCFDFFGAAGGADFFVSLKAFCFSRKRWAAFWSLIDGKYFAPMRPRRRESPPSANRFVLASPPRLGCQAGGPNFRSPPLAAGPAYRGFGMCAA